jgi:toxin ParE1/3/4
LTIFPAADTEVDAAAQCIARDNLSAALRFYDSVESTYSRIRDHPTRWPKYELDEPRLANVRKRSVWGFPNYLVFYRINEQVIEVLRVLCGAREIASILAEDLFE